MRTYKMALGLDFKAVVPQHFTDAMRELALSPDATEFITQLHNRFPDDDEEFTLGILKNGVRKGVREYLCAILQEQGIGGTIAPASVGVIDVSDSMDNAEPVLASEIDQALRLV